MDSWNGTPIEAMDYILKNTQDGLPDDVFLIGKQLAKDLEEYGVKEEYKGFKIIVNPDEHWKHKLTLIRNPFITQDEINAISQSGEVSKEIKPSEK